MRIHSHIRDARSASHNDIWQAIRHHQSLPCSKDDVMALESRLERKHVHSSRHAYRIYKPSPSPSQTLLSTSTSLSIQSRKAHKDRQQPQKPTTQSTMHSTTIISTLTLLLGLTNAFPLSSTLFEPTPQHTSIIEPLDKRSPQSLHHLPPDPGPPKKRNPQDYERTRAYFPPNGETPSPEERVFQSLYHLPPDPGPLKQHSPQSDAQASQNNGNAADSLAAEQQEEEQPTKKRSPQSAEQASQDNENAADSAVAEQQEEEASAQQGPGKRSPAPQDDPTALENEQQEEEQEGMAQNEGRKM